MGSETGAERARLEQLAEDYLDALAARDPDRLPLHPGFRQTENGQALALGDGLWGTANGRGTYRHLVADEQQQSIAFTAVLHENDRPVIVGIRLHAPGGRLAMAETVIKRSDILFYKDGPQKLEAMAAPAPIWQEPVPAADRMSRDELGALAGRYFATLERTTGVKSRRSRIPAVGSTMASGRRRRRSSTKRAIRPSMRSARPASSA
jgi:hypothetical protein